METTINTRLKELRESLNLSQTEFAHRIGLSIGAISKLENTGTTPRQANINKVIAATGVDREWLINGEGELTFNESPQTVPTSWKEEAYKRLENQVDEMKEEIQFLRELLLNMAKGKVPANFKDVSSLAGVGKIMNIGGNVRAVA